MNKTAIKNFAIWARNKLIADISYRAGLMGITAEGIHDALPQSTGQTEFYDIGTAEPYVISGEAILQRNHLVELIQRKEKDTNYKTAYKYVIEEVAYTWFNRLIAMRFMEVNDYLPSHIRVLSSDTGKLEPDLVTTPFDAELEFTNAEQQKIIDLKNDNKLDEVFRMLFIKQCNALNEILPALFEKTNDYTELLLNLSIIDQDGVVYHLVHDVPEEDFDVERGGQVEIIGWLYQYYNTELNDQVYDGNMSKNRVPKELLPAATTIYTPDWAIRYMTENSLGRLWLEGHSSEELKTKWKYYLGEAEQGQDVHTQLDEIRREYAQMNVEDIKVIDPCMGSGHILVYAFEILMQIYESAGYGQREAAISILENNLYGLDIDDRAFQIAYLAVMMKARQYNRRILNGEYKPNIYSIKESNLINRNQLKFFGAGLKTDERSKALQELNELINAFKDAKEYGSILKVKQHDWDLLYKAVSNVDTIGQLSFDAVGLDETAMELHHLVKQCDVLASKYHVIITNPPYLGNSRFSPKLDYYIKEYYPDVKSDLSMVMYKRAIDGFSTKNGFVSFITTSSWLTLSSFEKLRVYQLNNVSFISLVDYGTELFEGKVGHNPIVSWIIRNASMDYRMTAIRLVDYCYSRRDEKEPMFFEKRNHYYSLQKEFERIDGVPIAYWMSPQVLDAFNGTKVGDIATAKVGIGSGNTNYFLKLWTELDIRKISFHANPAEIEEILYVPINKGGAYRKWYGNNGYVINWKNNGAELKNYCDEKGKKLSYPRNLDYQLKESLTWGDITSGDFSLRYSPEGFFFSDVGNSLFVQDRLLMLYMLAYGNTQIFNETTNFLNQTMHFKPGNMLQMPLIIDKDNISYISGLAKQCIEISVEDWNSFEISWDFMRHPLVSKRNDAVLVEKAFEEWCVKAEIRYGKLQKNEYEINRFFNKLFKLPERDIVFTDSSISIRKGEKRREIVSLISYSVGCMLGRYSLDEDGVMYAGGVWDINIYKSFKPDKDNIIPITDEEYLEDDIVARFCTWLKVVFGERSLEANLDYIAQTLGTKGDSSREKLRTYFLNDFFKDHCQTYSITGSGKRPIYWLFDSGKQNGFKALVYLHRYNADTIGNLRIDYLHRMQRIYESEICRMQDMIDHSTNAREVGQASKRKDKLTKQLKECREYDEKLAHLALSRIELDLDDGVKVNYRKLQTANDGKFYEVLADSKKIMAKK